MRHSLALGTNAALASALLLAAPVQAQTGAAERCMALPSDSARLDCMRTALDQAERKLENAGLRERSGEALQAAAPSPAPTPASHPPEARSEEKFAALGAEQVAARQRRPLQDSKESDRFAATVVSFAERVPGRMRFELDNGQVWQQTAADAQRLRLNSGQAFGVELWSTWSGGYRMHLPDQRLNVRVERVR